MAFTQIHFNDGLNSTPQAIAVKLAQLGEGQAATLAKQTSWNRSMDEKQDTAVRHLKKQNGTKCRN